MRKRILVSVLAVMILGAASIFAYLRICDVNSNLPIATIEEYSLGEPVKLDGSFLVTTEEDNKNYELTVISAERLSYNEYVSKYGKGKTQTKEGQNDKSIIDVELKIRNNGSKLGCFSLYEMRLVPEQKNKYYIAQDSILQKSIKAAPKWPNPISTEPHSTFTIHVPFTINSDNEAITKGYIEGKNFTLFLTDYPVSKRVTFAVD